MHHLRRLSSTFSSSNLTEWKTAYQQFVPISTSCLSMFWEKDEKGGYRKDPIPSVSLDNVRAGLKEMKDEILLWKDEVVEKLTDDPAIFMDPGDHDIVWRFDNTSVLDKFVVTSDKDHLEGHSEGYLTLSKNKKGLFHGTLRTELVKEGTIVRTGYCNMRSMRPRKSFKRDSTMDWQMFTHLLMRVRGDGRSYMLNLSTAGYYDVSWNDVYQFILFTRGGPYWQMVKIPFSKFFLSSKGRVQDKQFPISLGHISNVGITCMDKVPGPFQLEIDYIGLHYDPSHIEEFAYEMYSLPKFIVGS